jgi:histidyl-tRNA synthetase
MAADCLEALGIKRGDYVVKVNNRKVLDGLLEAVSVGRDVDLKQRIVILRAIDKLDRLGPGGVFGLLTSGRKDESGDFTPGAGLSTDEADNVMRFLGYSQDVERGYEPDVALAQTLQNTERLDWLTNHVALGPTGAQGVRELREIAELAAAAGYGENRILVDRSVVRGLEYYTGSVFEAELTFETRGEDGKPIRFGSVGGGGRYDGLVARFRGEPVPATGFSIGVSRLLSALRAINSPIVAAAAKPGPVVVVVLDRDHMADYQRLTTALRGAGIAAEMYLGASGLNAQLKYADKRGSLCAVIQGSNERDAAGGPQVVIRDLRLGAALAKTSKDRSDYLELRQRAQFAAPESELVARVSEVVTRGRA